MRNSLQKKIVIIFSILPGLFYVENIFAQNIGVNTTGAAAAATNMFEVLQPSTTANSVGVYVSHTGAITGYALQALKSGAGVNNIAAYLSSSGGTNNYSLIVPSGGGWAGIGTTAPNFLLDIQRDITMDGDITPDKAQLSLGGSSTPGKRMILGYDVNGNGFAYIKAGNYGVSWTNLSLQPNGGNVGVGTTGPVQKLEVSGNIKFNDKAYFGNWFLGATSSWPNGPGITLTGGDETFGLSSTGGQTSLQLDGGFRQAETGKVNYFLEKTGFGTTNPQQMIQLSAGNYIGIASNGGTYIPTSWNRGNAGGIIFSGSANSDGSGWSYGSRMVNHDYGDGLALSFDVNYNTTWTNDALTVSGRSGRIGYIGLGTISPGDKLDVAGNIRIGSSASENTIKFYGLTGDNPGGYDHTVISERLFSGSDKAELLFFKGNDVDACGGCGDRIRFDTPGSILFQTGNGYRTYNPGTEGTNAMLINSDANVGIGTTSPSTQLHTTGGVRFQNYTGGLLKVDGSGNLGIGTSGDLPSHTHPWSQITSKPAAWLDAANLIQDLANFNNSVPSGFYQGYNSTNSPTGSTWYNLLNVRHSNTGNDHGFQIAASYYDENIWTRTYQGGTGANNGSFTAWRSLMHSGNIGTNAILNQNSSVQSANFIISGTGRADGDFRAPIYYDQNNTGYYVDPNGNSQVSSIYANNWFRGQGSSGLYFQDYGGGWHMSDGTWIRSYGGKNIYCDALIRADNGFEVDGLTVIDGDAGWHRTYGNTGWYNGSYGGGMYMTDATWVRVYNSKNLWVDGRIRTNGINETSDARFKKNINKIENALESISKMQGVTFDWKKEEFANKGFEKGKQYGLIAQEVEKIIPEIVHTDEEGYKSIEYSHLVPLLIEAIKEQKEEIAHLKIQMNEFSARMKIMENSNAINNQKLISGIK